MLRLVIPPREFFDDNKQEFIYTKECTLQLEHSLVSLDKWESKWCKPFLSSKDKTFEETMDYIKCMTLTQNVDPNVYYLLTRKNIEEINNYINAPMTATTIYEPPGKAKNREIVTAEIIYYWMIALNIPFECRKWHLNKLLTLIRVCNIKNTPPKKMGKRELLNRNAALNAERRKKTGSKG